MTEHLEGECQAGDAADEPLSPSPEDEYLLLGIMQLAQLVADLVETIQFMDDSLFTGEEIEKLSIIQIRLALIRWGKWKADTADKEGT